jgi:hypothetical protein
VQTFPCKYLGIPLSVYKLKRSEEQFLIDKVAARILAWKGSMLNVAGRTALVKATLSSIPIHTSITLSGHLPATREKAILALFQAAMVVTLGNGEYTFFWTDKWIGGSSFATLAPNVFAAVRARKRMASVAEALPGSAWVRHIAAAPSIQLLYEIDLICDLLDDVHLSQQPDTFSWSLSADHCYSTASAYGAMFLGSSPVLGAKHI